MDVALVRFLALHLTPAITAAARPAATFAVVQLISALLVWNGHAAIPEAMAWLVSPAAVIFGVVFAVIETLSRHDPDFEELLIEVHLDKVVGAFGALAAPLLFACLGLPEDDAMGLGATTAAASADPVSATLATVALADRPPLVTAAAVGGAVGINLVLTKIRAEVLEFLRNFQLSKVWLRIETGGVVVVLALMPLMPVVGCTLLVASTLVLALVAWTVRGARAALDRRVRVPCVHCDHAVRPEASICASCGGALTPTVLLDQPGTVTRRWRAALGAIRAQRGSGALETAGS